MVMQRTCEAPDRIRNLVISIGKLSANRPEALVKFVNSRYVK
jgi:hypothetical protein